MLGPTRSVCRVVRRADAPRDAAARDSIRRSVGTLK